MPYPMTLLPFQPATMSSAQLAAVSYLARYSGRTHVPPHAPQEFGPLGRGRRRTDLISLLVPHRTPCRPQQ